MRTSLVIAAIMMMCAAVAVSAQEQPLQGADAATQSSAKQHRPHSHQAAPEAKKQAPIPSIIQSELDRSRAEAIQHPAPALQPPVKSAPVHEPLWPVILSVFIAACATGVIVFFFFLKKSIQFPFPYRRAAADVRAASGAKEAATVAAAAAQASGEPAAPMVSVAPEEEASGFFGEEDLVSSAAPYVIEDENEAPEAALTMNLINKKRETKKEIIQDVMRRVQRKEKPQQIAEALRVGVGEVHLAMALAKLKK
jgi:hypothetical protein